MDVRELKSNLEKLSKCKGLSQSDLNGKYKKAYQKLISEINKCTHEILMYIVLTGIKCTDEALADDINAFIETPEGKSIIEECKQHIRACSYEDFIDTCYKMRDHVKRMAWKYAPSDWDSIEFDIPHIKE